MKKSEVLALDLTAALSAFLLTGCGTRDTRITSVPGGGIPAEIGTTGAANELSMCFASESETMDPSINRAVDSSVIITHPSEGLYEWADSDPSGDGRNDAIAALEPGMTVEESTVTPNEDGTYTYTFKLREDAKWSDDQPTIANDFVYSWRRLVDPVTASPYGTIITMVRNVSEITAGELSKKELSIAAPDEHTFEVTLTYNCLYSLDICAFPNCMPLRENVVEGSAAWTQDPSIYVINGAFKIASWTHDVETVTVLGENYYGASSITLGKLTLKLMDDASTQLTAFKDGDLNYMQNPPPDEMATLLADGTTIPGDYLGSYYAYSNNAKEPFNDPLVRKALSLVAGRNYVVEQVTQAGEIAADAWVPASVVDARGTSGGDSRIMSGSYWNVSKGDYEANCEEVRKLLAEVGYENDVGLSEITYLYNTNNKHQTVAEALQSMWKNVLGVEVTLNNQDWNIFLETRLRSDYSTYRNGRVADYNDPVSFLDILMANNGNNDTHYSNAGYDVIMAKILSDSDAAGRMELMYQAEDLFVSEDQAIAPLYYYSQPHMMTDSVHGMYYTPLGNFLSFHTTKG